MNNPYEDKGFPCLLVFIFAFYFIMGLIFGTMIG